MTAAKGRKVMASQATSSPTPAMQAWLQELETILGAAVSSPASEAEQPSPASTKSSLVGGVGDIPDPVGTISCTCAIINNTDQILLLDPASANEVNDSDKIGLAHGKYNAKPPQRINAQQKDGKFKAVNKQIFILPHTTGVEGRVR